MDPTPFLGPNLIGMTFNMCLYGVTLGQTVLYFRHFGDDRYFLKMLVAILVLLETGQTIGLAHVIYTYTVLGRLDPGKLINTPRSYSVVLVIMFLIAFVVQLFFVYRIWKPAEESALVTFHLASAMAYTGFVSKTSATLSSVGARDTELVGIVQTSSAAFTDLFITASLIWYLRSFKSHYASTRNLIKRIVFVSMNMGVLTCLMGLIMARALPQIWIYSVFFFCVSRTYVNSLLATLNVRKSVNGEGLLADDYNPSSNHRTAPLERNRGVTGVPDAHVHEMR